MYAMQASRIKPVQLVQEKAHSSKHLCSQGKNCFLCSSTPCVIVCAVQHYVVTHDNKHGWQGATCERLPMLQPRAGVGRLPQLYEATVHLQLRMGLLSRLLSLVRSASKLNIT